MTDFRIDQKLAEKLMNYLAQRPWIEVRELLDGLMTMKPVTEEKTDDVAEK